MTCRKSEASLRATTNVLVKTFVLPSPGIEHKALCRKCNECKCAIIL